ncbi:Structural maintenance of chromosomes protein 3 [Bienertia sinuspersici]
MKRCQLKKIGIRFLRSQLKCTMLFLSLRRDARTWTRDFKRLSKEHQVLSKEKVAVEKRRTDAIQRKTQLELDCRDLKERISRSSRAKMREDAMTKGIMEREKKLSILYQKQGRATQFSSKAARDEWLSKEIDELKREQKLQVEIDNLNAQLRDQDDLIQSRKANLAMLENSINQSNEGFIASKGQRDGLQDERKSLWERENELSSEIEN